MKIVISEQQLKNIINEQIVGDSAYMTPEERFNTSNDKYWDVYSMATDQEITQIGKNIYTPCKGGDTTKCRQVRDYSSTDSLIIYNTGRVSLKNKSTGVMGKKGTLIAMDMDHFRINWDDGSAVEKKSDPNWSGGVNSNTTNTNSTCASSFDQLKKGSGKLLQKGCKSDIVKQLQTMLGMEQKFQTGLFGDITKGKVIEFQKTHKDSKGINLKPDGIVGEKTYTSLKSST